MAGIDINDYLDTAAPLYQEVLHDREQLLMELGLTCFSTVKHKELRDLLEDLRKAYFAVVKSGWDDKRRNWCRTAYQRVEDVMARIRATPDSVPGMKAFLALEMRVHMMKVNENTRTHLITAAKPVQRRKTPRV